MRVVCLLLLTGCLGTKDNVCFPTEAERVRDERIEIAIAAAVFVAVMVGSAVAAHQTVPR